MVIHTKSPSETIRLGKQIGSLLRSGEVVALTGELGTGKTYFIKGLAAGAGITTPDTVSSPSFTFINEYSGRVSFYHVDLFRLESEREAEELGLEEVVQGPGITAVEWADKFPSLLPDDLLLIEIRHTGKQTRSIQLVGRGKRYLNLVNQIQSSEFVVRSSEQKIS